MKVSLRWLGRHVDLSDKSPQQVLEDLTMSTAEVEGIEEYAAGLDGVVVGHVLARERHPDADKLSVTSVDVGRGEPLQVVCGAPNVAAGQRVAVVLPGAALPDGTRIKKSKIRGVESFGMICSEKELGLGDASAGILVLPDDTAIGRPLTEALDLRDHVLEIDNKSINHRPDLWGHYGLARELAAIWGRPLRPLDAPPALPASGPSPRIVVADAAACPRYCGLLIEGVRSVPAPDWLRWQLAAVGIRPIDLLVDLTNFVMADLGQPMHAFDLARLEGANIGVRRARVGERLTTLDGVVRELDPEDLVITSGDVPVALAGVMGGEGSMVGPATTAILLESANFHAATIRRTATRLGLRTDASARFEKALDPALAETAVQRFVALLRELMPEARPSGPLADPTGWRYDPTTIRLRKARLDLKLGVALPRERVARILSSLAFEVRGAEDGLDVTVPSFRATKDVRCEDDLIEEVGRMFRYDNIPEQPLVSTVAVPAREPEPWLCRRMITIAATELGCHEVYNYSFAPDAVLAACEADDHEYARVLNPVAPETARVRRHVLPSVLACLAPNLRRRRTVRLVEDGKGYHPEKRDRDGLPHEVREIAFAFADRDGGRCYDELRLAVERLLQRVGHPAVFDTLLADVATGGKPPWIHPGRTVAVRRQDQVIGYVGTLHPRVARRLELPLATAIATLEVRALLESGRQDLRYRPISSYPEQPVDVALLVDAGARVRDLASLLREANPKLVQAVELFEVYAGGSVPAGKKSVNFTVTLGASDRTLTAKDEEKYLARVREGCAAAGIELRG